MLTIKETLDAKKFTYQITNEFGEAQPFTVLNLYRHVGYPMHVIQNTMSNGKDAVINLAKRYLPLTMLWYGEQRLDAFYQDCRKRLPTAYASPIERVLKEYRKFNDKTEFFRTPETQDMLQKDRDDLAPIFSQELQKFFFTADNQLRMHWKDDLIRRLFIEILIQRMLVRMVIEDTIALKMEIDPEATAIDQAQAKALTVLCGGNHAGTQDKLKLYHNTIETLSVTEINIIFNKLQEHLTAISEVEKDKYEQRLKEKAKKAKKAAAKKKAKTAEPAADGQPEAKDAKPKTNARAQERAQDPNRRGKTIK